MFGLSNPLWAIAIIIAVSVVLTFGKRFIAVYKQFYESPMTVEDITKFRGFPLTKDEEDEITNTRSDDELLTIVKRLMVKKRPRVRH